MHIKLFEKFKTYDYIALVIMLICIFMSIIFLVRAALSKTVNVEVTTIPKINYKVHLKNNDYFALNKTVFYDIIFNHIEDSAWMKTFWNQAFDTDKKYDAILW